MTTVAVVLAAGRGTRFTGSTHKLRAPFRGRPLVTWAIDAALDAGLDETWLVTGAVDLADLVPPSVRVLVNSAWADGQATSVACATDAAAEAGVDAIVVGLGDQPLVPASSWAAVARSGSPIAVCTYEGRRRNPVRLAREVWPLLDRTGDEGARTVMRRRPDLVEEVACAGVAIDVDTVEDLSQWS